MLQTLESARSDIRAAFRLRHVWIALASEDIGDQHRRTALGPLLAAHQLPGLRRHLRLALPPRRRRRGKLLGLCGDRPARLVLHHGYDHLERLPVRARGELHQGHDAAAVGLCHEARHAGRHPLGLCARRLPGDPAHERRIPYRSLGLVGAGARRPPGGDAGRHHRVRLSRRVFSRTASSSSRT